MEPPITSLLWRSLRVHQIFGANTNVGKTVLTTLLSRTAASSRKGEHVSFLKPVSTGAPDEADDYHVGRFAKGVTPRTLVQYDLPVSPHLAAQQSGKRPISDYALLASCREFAAECAARGKGWLFVETAGGVHSPVPSGRTQADAYAPLRIPVILVGDSQLGGISQTISAFESLHLRGYTVESVLLFKDTKFANYQYLSEYFDQHHSIPVNSFPEPPERVENTVEDAEAMAQYYSHADCEEVAGQVLNHLDRRHSDRIEALQSLSKQAHDHIWYPFTQQTLVQQKDITTIDSAHGDYFQTLTAPTHTAQSVLSSSFDGSASWWTQGLGHANPQLTLAAAHAAGRYGHVMFAGAVHAPAMSLAQSLLKNMGNPRLNRVFFSDNGSTGTEVAVKMGLRAARVRYGWGTEDRIGVLGLTGGYHGDTIGAMDMSEPCSFNEKVEWYEGKGYWFDCPSVLCTRGEWSVSDAPSGQGKKVYNSLNDIFDITAREQRGEHVHYEERITNTLKELQLQGRKFGSLVIEPIVLGAGGMKLVDPLFQRALVNVVRRSEHLIGRPNAAPKDSTDWSGLPVIFDEVFTGLYRLGRFTPSSFINAQPDISVHAKLLTGGLVPLSVTLASEHIFDVFRSDDKTDALLHGHSYTAHPIGCQVAVESLREMMAMNKRGEWNWAKSRGGWIPSESSTPSPSGDDEPVWSVWSRQFVESLSHNTERVEGLWALGNVLAIHLYDAAGSGYGSKVAQDLREALAKDNKGSWNVHSRVLGNVIYVMTSQTTTESSVRQIEDLLRKLLQVA